MTNGYLVSVFGACAALSLSAQADQAVLRLFG